MTRGVKIVGRPVWAEVSLGALERNLRAIRRHIGQASASKNGRPGKAARRGPMILAVVKGDAYGHGAVPVARALEKAGADWFGVTSADEGAELREAGVRGPILVLTGYWSGEEKRLIEYRLTPTVTRCQQLRSLDRAVGHARRKPRGSFGFHLKIDSGMNRLGISPGDVPCFARTLGECRHLRLDGTFTHFASSDVFTTEQTRQQQSVFLCALEQLRSLGVDPGTVHMANSAAIASRPDTWADMVRPGAILYGYHQYYEPPELKAAAEAKLPLEPVMTLQARVVSLREVPPGGGVGYGATFVTSRPSRIAVISAGYADGLVRSLSNRGRVILRGQFAPLVGIISMDLSAVDVTDFQEAAVGDLVTIFGSDGAASQYVSEVAHEIGTVTSDLLCSLGKRVPRLYRR